MFVMALAGKARVGKDTIGNHLVREHGFARCAFAQPLKDMLTAIGFDEADFQTTEEKERVLPEIGRSYRYLAQTLGTEWGRAAHPDFWVLMLAKRVQAYAKAAKATGQPARIVITDTRFENEAAWVRSVGGVVVHVLGNSQFGMSAEAKAHPSEAGIQFVQGDKLLFNHYDEPSAETLKGLYASVDALVNGLLAGREAA